MSQSSTAIQKQDRDKILERVIAKGDLADLSPTDRVSYYNAVCHSLKLNPLTKPFDFLEVFDKETNKTKIVLYANKDCATQLKANHDVSIWKVETKTEDGCLIAIAYARTPDGREDIDEGAVWVKGLASQSLANARMKAVTKAKRRVTLSICGLGFLDESEIDSIPNAQTLPDSEQDAVMTEAKSEALTLSHRASGLDQWKCGRGLAMVLILLCKRLEEIGMTEEIWRVWLPEGITSRIDLTENQARETIADFTSRLKLIETCMILGQKGVDKETMRLKLPNGKKSVKDLNTAETQEALKHFTHWLKSYEEAVNNG